MTCHRERPEIELPRAVLAGAGAIVKVKGLDEHGTWLAKSLTLLLPIYRRRDMKFDVASKALAPPLLVGFRNVGTPS
jgi:hypothetical protein